MTRYKQVILCDKVSRLTSYRSPWPVTKKHTRCACSLDRMLMNLLKWVTLRRVRNSINLSLMSRGWMMLSRCSLCGHVMQPAVAISVRNAWFGSRRSSKWIRLTFTVRLWASSKGLSSPQSTISTINRWLFTMINLALTCTKLQIWRLFCINHHRRNEDDIGSIFVLTSFYLSLKQGVNCLLLQDSSHSRTHTTTLSYVAILSFCLKHSCYVKMHKYVAKIHSAHDTHIILTGSQTLVRYRNVKV